MQGIYFINENICLNGLPEQDSIQLQMEAIKEYIRNQQIQVVKLNPAQLYDYYTILHALLYDLKKTNIPLDCLMVYSLDTIADYLTTYTARWLIIKSFFHEIIAIEQAACQPISAVKGT